MQFPPSKKKLHEELMRSRMSFTILWPTVGEGGTMIYRMKSPSTVLGCSNNGEILTLISVGQGRFAHTHTHLHIQRITVKVQSHSARGS